MIVERVLHADEPAHIACLFGQLLPPLPFASLPLQTLLDRVYDEVHYLDVVHDTVQLHLPMKTLRDAGRHLGCARDRLGVRRAELGRRSLQRAASPHSCGRPTRLRYVSPAVGPGARAGPLSFITGAPGPRAVVQLLPDYPKTLYPTKVLI